MTNSISNIRQDYSKAQIEVGTLLTTPVEQFKIWLNEAIVSKVNEPTAMVLSTVSNNRPSSRVVLLKEVREEGFVFFTNYTSEKGNEMAENPFVSLNFFWPELERQVRVEGAVKKVSDSESESYFKSRPLGSQIGAWASPQSKEIESRELLENNVKKYTDQFGSDVQRPPFWGGYCLVPDKVEFWQGRSNRLHDRIEYQLENGFGKRCALLPKNYFRLNTSSTPSFL